MIDAFIETLRQTPPLPGTANPYRIFEEGVDCRADAAEVRAAQLASYLARRIDSAELILVAEAPGYQGARFSGIAMTCERTLLGAKSGVPAGLVLEPGLAPQRTSTEAVARNGPERAGGFSEPTASIVWRELISHGLTGRVILWNVFPLHPRAAGQPLTNRTPTREEVGATLHVVEQLFATFPDRRVVCIGNTSRDHLSRLLPGVPAIRHPANGGATKFRRGLEEVMSGG